MGNLGKEANESLVKFSIPNILESSNFKMDLKAIYASRQLDFLPPRNVTDSNGWFTT
ncbi:3616_t:CDS:2 [Dentiscutata erythropus]|uniref:3616_t:CDS:1 n=1 Tax=Dentiscutata erythropus TaxID=1348616 RepID=A0A9N9FKI9_9GLOM|nr:3616_t:CDS:2 [Dentiscutata erythropus]